MSRQQQQVDAFERQQKALIVATLERFLQATGIEPQRVSTE